MAVVEKFSGMWLRTLWQESDPPESTVELEKRPGDTMFTVDSFEKLPLSSYALWIQSPPTDTAATSHPYFLDVRCVPKVKGKFGNSRWFAGSLSVSSASKEEQNEANALSKSWSLQGDKEVPCCRLTWRRDIDSLPESCPSGIDSAMCFLLPPTEWRASQKPYSWESLSASEDQHGNWTLVEAGDGYLEVWERISSWNEAQKPAAASLLLTESQKVKSIEFTVGDKKSYIPVSGRITVSDDLPAVVELNIL